MEGKVILENNQQKLSSSISKKKKIEGIKTNGKLSGNVEYLNRGVTEFSSYLRRARIREERLRK